MDRRLALVGAALSARLRHGRLPARRRWRGRERQPVIPGIDRREAARPHPPIPRWGRRRHDGNRLLLLTSASAPPLRRTWSSAAKAARRSRWSPLPWMRSSVCASWTAPLTATRTRLRPCPSSGSSDSWITASANGALVTPPASSVPPTYAAAPSEGSAPASAVSRAPLVSASQDATVAAPAWARPARATSGRWSSSMPQTASPSARGSAPPAHPGQTARRGS